MGGLRRWVDHVRQDLFFALRTIPRTKTTSLAVIVAFALGIGANAAIFSLVNTVLLAVVLALVGIYGVLSYLVAERTPEIGLRLALGELRGDVFRRVIGGSMRLVVAGVVIGVAGALAAVRLLQSMLFDVSPRDPLTLAAVIGLLVITAFAASSIPALRAANLDPLAALRDE